MRKDTYIIEPRLENGALGYCDYSKFPHSFITGITEDELYDAYFSAHPGENSANHEQLTAWLQSYGLKMRRKTW
jgi:hypothetical protein